MTTASPATTQGDGTLTYDVGGGTVTQGLDSVVTYFTTVTFTDGTTATVEGDIIQMTNGDLFFTAYQDNTVLDDKPISSITFDTVSSNTWTGIYQSNFEQIAFVCFTPGTYIDTPSGNHSVENLRIGDLVTTRDHSAQPLRWIGKRTLHFDHTSQNQKPWQIKSGSMGNALPSRDLILSPQHHILLEGADVRTFTGGNPQAIASVKSLAQMPGVHQMKGKNSVTYYSLLFDHHEIIFANDLNVESFYPGPYGLSLLTPLQRLRVFSRFPKLHSDPENGYGPHARTVLTARQAEKLAVLRRHLTRPPTPTQSKVA